jgi:hypothetical protein
LNLQGIDRAIGERFDQSSIDLEGRDLLDG